MYNRVYSARLAPNLHLASKAPPSLGTEQTASFRSPYPGVANMTIEDELSGINRELSMFPERAFDFAGAGTIVIEQVRNPRWA